MKIVEISVSFALLVEQNEVRNKSWQLEFLTCSIDWDLSQEIMHRKDRNDSLKNALHAPTVCRSLIT